MTKAQAKAAAPVAPAVSPEMATLEVNQLGDVTEPKFEAPSLSAGLIEISAIAELPADIAKTYPGAVGFTQEAGLTVLHF
jgi:hypothetical protein